MNQISQTRFKLVILGLALGLVEGILRAILKDFPVIEAYGFQGAIIGSYLGIKTASNIKRMRIEEGGEPKP